MRVLCASDDRFYNISLSVYEVQSDKTEYPKKIKNKIKHVLNSKSSLQYLVYAEALLGASRWFTQINSEAVIIDRSFNSQSSSEAGETFDCVYKVQGCNTRH